VTDVSQSPGPNWGNVVVAAALAVWLGGLVVYALIVIPVGADVLGGEAAFGFVTRRVTVVLNHVVTGVLVLVVLHRFVPGARRPGRVENVAVVVMIVCQVALYLLHPWLDELLDPVARSIKDGDAFYERHRVYLLVTTVQWLAGVVFGRGLIR